MPVPATGARARRVAETRARIERAALALFAERGYAATPVALVAEHAQVGERTVYRHFPRKRDLVFGDAAEHVAVLRGAVDAAPAGAGPAEVLRAACAALAAVLIAEDVRARAQVASTDGDLVLGALEVRHRMTAELADAVGTRCGLAASDARYLAEVALAAMNEAVIRWSGGGRELPEVLDEVFALSGPRD